MHTHSARGESRCVLQAIALQIGQVCETVIHALYRICSSHCLRARYTVITYPAGQIDFSESELRDQLVHCKSLGHQSRFPEEAGLFTEGLQNAVSLSHSAVLLHPPITAADVDVLRQAFLRRWKKAQPLPEQTAKLSDFCILTLKAR